MSTQVEPLRPTSIIAPVSGWRRLLGDWLVVGYATWPCSR